MSTGDSARKNYEMAKLESISRIQTRDQVLVAYISVVGVIFGAAIGISIIDLALLLIIPYLTLGAAIIVSQHNSVIGSLGSFFAYEVEPFLREIGESAPQWETSTSLRDYSLKMIWSRSLGQFILLLTPPFTGLVLYWNPSNVLWWGGVVCAGLSTFSLIESHIWRWKLYNKKERFVKG